MTKMLKHRETKKRRYFPGDKPGDFPVASLESRVAARTIVDSYRDEQRKKEGIDFENLTPLEEVMIEDVDDIQVRIWIILLYRVAKEREKAYGLKWQWPTPAEIRHRRVVVKEIERITGRDSLSLEMSNPAEWNRLMAIAENNLRAKGK
jgi:hypothetical protein